MDARQIQDRLRTTLGWRVGDHTARYILDRLKSPKPRAFKVFAADARTGRAVYERLDPTLLDENDPQGRLFGA